MKPFTIDVSDDVLADLNNRLERTRFPDQLEGAEWAYGTEISYLRELCAYWKDEYDWRVHEEALNRLSHFRTEIEGLGIHFIHERSKHENAFPLIITHGWPGSIFEFTKILGPLTDPESHGGKAEDAFHVVCPSMPGYGFSDAPREPGFDVRRVAQINSALMAKLGYTRYGAQGGDWGASATAWTALQDPEHVAGIHMNMLWTARPKGDQQPELTEEDERRLVEARQFIQNETGYQRIQGTKPQTLGYGLNDSPAGLAAWIVEKFRTWSDCDGNVENRFTKDELLTNIMIYWVTESITSSMRLYYETLGVGRTNPAEHQIKPPAAFAIFPKELTRLPRAWAEQHYDVQQWTEMPSGGHFAALEEPELLVEDIRKFFRTIRNGN